MPQDVDFGRLADELEERFTTAPDALLDGVAFNRLALAAFRLQYERIPPYRAFSDARDRSPATVERWQEVPAVPARALKHIDFAVTEPELVFLTSGTTRGPERRGRHLVPRASLYRASLLPPFERHVLGSGEARTESGPAGPAARMPFVSLIPSPESMPDSSLSYMVGAAADAWASETAWVVDASGRLDEDALRTRMADAAGAGEPTLLLGTALAFLHALERLEAVPGDLLPVGSRIMETGGLKGLGREIDRDELYTRIAAATGVPRERIVSEYGMTELLSQLYDPVLSEGPHASGAYVPAPWLRVRALDPATLDEVAPGRPGLLAFFDLANAGSVCHLLTEDVGSVVDGRVRLQGRVRGAEPRGCSRAMDELMSAAGEAG